MSSPDPTDLHSLRYTSRAIGPMTSADLQRILRGARARNADEGVTGVLLFVGGNFMQYLEGSSEALDRVFAVIEASSLHSEIVIEARSPITERLYPDWSMAFMADGPFTTLANSPADLSVGTGDVTGLAQAASAESRRELGRFWRKEA